MQVLFSLGAQEYLSDTRNPCIGKTQPQLNTPKQSSGKYYMMQKSWKKMFYIYSVRS